LGLPLYASPVSELPPALTSSLCQLYEPQTFSVRAWVPRQEPRIQVVDCSPVADMLHLAEQRVNSETIWSECDCDDIDGRASHILAEISCHWPGQLNESQLSVPAHLSPLMPGVPTMPGVWYAWCVFPS